MTAKQLLFRSGIGGASAAVLPSEKRENLDALNRILYPTDFSLESLAAAPIAVSLAQEHQAQLILLHCVGPDREDVESVRCILADVVPFGVKLKAAPDCIVERGRPAEKILEVADRYKVDLILLGINREEDPGIETVHSLHPAVFRIVTEAKCPVLTVNG